MEFVGYILLSIAAIIGFSIICFLPAILLVSSKSKKAQKLEQDNINEIGELKNRLQELKSKLQSIRIGEYKLTEADTLGIEVQESSGDWCSCFFCSGRIIKSALVCKFCARPNVENLQEIVDNEESVKTLLRQI